MEYTGMSLLDFARGPGLQISLGVLVFGCLWRLVGILVLNWQRRDTVPVASRAGGALRTLFNRFLPRPGFGSGTRTGYILGYISHIGLAIVVFGGVFHIMVIRELSGLSWPALPPVIITGAAVAALVAFIALLVRRLTDPVLRLISDWDDYFSWFVVVLPLLTGLVAGTGLGASYESLLALHILSVELLFLWLPFGKLFHAFSFAPSRAWTGANYGRRGVRA
jgi:nitrate reductase gamma subunit